MSESLELSISNTTKGRFPSLPYQKMKDAVLGKKYELSLVFIGDKKSQNLNRTYRDKNKPTNILSFSLSKSSGEIFINLRLSKKQAKNFDRKFDNFIGFLFIHGLFHLKGFDHGDTMEKRESFLRKKFGI